MVSSKSITKRNRIYLVVKFSWFTAYQTVPDRSKIQEDKEAIQGGKKQQNVLKAYAGYPFCCCLYASLFIIEHH